MEVRMERVVGTYRDGAVQLPHAVSWPEGSEVLVFYIPGATGRPLDHENIGHIIIAGFGLAGRFVADVFHRHGIPFVLVDSNARTVEVQRGLGAKVIEGDIRDEAVLRAAGVERASVLALTVPDEKAVLEATSLAKRLNPHIYIVARTQYTSSGLEAARLGADEVVQAEYAVAMQFYQSFLRKLEGAKASDGTKRETS